MLPLCTLASLFASVLLILFGPTIARFKYYFGWSLAETAFVACGISYKGYGVEWSEAEIADGAKEVVGKKGLRWDGYT